MVRQHPVVDPSIDGVSWLERHGEPGTWVRINHDTLVSSRHELAVMYDLAVACD
jgi:hypothetical protein